jgi:GTPase
VCKEHVGIALALKVPACYVVTKIDMAPAEVTKATLADLSAVLKKPGVRKRPFIVRTNDDVFAAAANIASDTMAPIFLVSSVDGRGLDRLRLFLNLLPPRVQWGAREEDPAEFVIDEVFGIPGVGTVVAGTCTAGTISAASSLLLGPDPGDGQFKACAIKSIHYKRVSAKHIVAGQSAAFALKRIKRGAVRKGMVLVSPALSPHAIWEFDAEVAILTHSSTMRPRYQAVVHAGVVRQSAVVVAMSKDLLRSGDRAHVRFRFLQRPEFLASGVRFLFREVRLCAAVQPFRRAHARVLFCCNTRAQGRTKGIGVVLPPGGSVPMAEPAADADAPA